MIGRTIPSFRIAAVLEEEKWKEFRKYLRNTLFFLKAFYNIKDEYFLYYGKLTLLIY